MRAEDIAKVREDFIGHTPAQLEAIMRTNSHNSVVRVAAKIELETLKELTAEERLREIVREELAAQSGDKPSLKSKSTSESDITDKAVAQSQSPWWRFWR